MLDYVTTFDDPSGVFSRWLLDGASRDNTDHGRAYTRITEAGGDFTVSLYSDPDRTMLAAQGTLSGSASGDVTLAEQNSSGLSGRVRLRKAYAFDATIDACYADDEDLLPLHKNLNDFLVGGEFAGRPGFAMPLARAKRVVDALMNARFARGWRADDLRPLADVTAAYALYFVFDHLSSRADDPAGQLAAAWRRNARRALPLILISIGGELHTPFIPRVERA
ncbi:MAG: hypothetical protein H6839_15845 [Planctomycetes bacterium]|nr:hypothetical protein [Planctomycetota bacterium]